MGGQPDMGSLGRDLDRFGELGAGIAELSLFGYGVLAGGRQIKERVRKLKQICDSRAMTYTAHGPIALNFFDSDRLTRHKDICRAYIGITADIGAKLMVIHAGIADLSSGQEPDVHFSRQRDALAEMGDYAAKAGVTLAVENVFVTAPGLYTPSPARLGQELEAVGHPNVVGVLDVSHAHIAAAWSHEDAAKSIQRFSPQIGHLHIHDSFGRPTTMTTYTEQEALAYGIGDLHLPIGWGSIDWTGLLTEMTVRPETIFMVELKRDYWDFLEETAAKARGLAALIDMHSALAEQHTAA